MLRVLTTHAILDITVHKALGQIPPVYFVLLATIASRLQLNPSLVPLAITAMIQVARQ